MIRWLPLAASLAGLAIVFAFSGGTAVGQPTGDVAHGEAIYRASCAMCHGADATGMMGMHPALTGVVQRLTVEGVQVTIRQGRDTRPPMPAFGDQLSDDDIADLIAYLGTLPPGPRNFGPEVGRGRGGDGGMGGDVDGMMRDMMGGGPVALWLVILLLATALAGTIGYLAGLKRR